MAEAETESLAKRYIRYLGLDCKEKTAADTDVWYKIKVGNYMFSSYGSFLFGNGKAEYSYNRITKTYVDDDMRTISYSSAEELDFKLSAAGF